MTQDRKLSKAEKAKLKQAKKSLAKKLKRGVVEGRSFPTLDATSLLKEKLNLQLALRKKLNPEEVAKSRQKQQPQKETEKKSRAEAAIKALEEMDKSTAAPTSKDDEGWAPPVTPEQVEGGGTFVVRNEKDEAQQAAKAGGYEEASNPKHDEEHMGKIKASKAAERFASLFTPQDPHKKEHPIQTEDTNVLAKFQERLKTHLEQLEVRDARLTEAAKSENRLKILISNWEGVIENLSPLKIPQNLSDSDTDKVGKVIDMAEDLIKKAKIKLLDYFQEKIKTMPREIQNVTKIDTLHRHIEECNEAMQMIHTVYLLHKKDFPKETIQKMEALSKAVAELRDQAKKQLAKHKDASNKPTSTPAASTDLASVSSKKLDAFETRLSAFKDHLNSKNPQQHDASKPTIIGMIVYCNKIIKALEGINKNPSQKPTEQELRIVSILDKAKEVLTEARKQLLVKGAEKSERTIKQPNPPKPPESTPGHKL